MQIGPWSDIFGTSVNYFSTPEDAELQDGFAGYDAGADLLDVLCGKGPLGREAKRIEFPHGDSVQVARVVKSFSRLVDVAQDSAHAHMISTIKFSDNPYPLYVASSRTT